MLAEDSAFSIPGLKYSMEVHVVVGDLVHAVAVHFYLLSMGFANRKLSHFKLKTRSACLL
jgi:hypothetical protein